jgi:hypothetical protein
MQSNDMAPSVRRTRSSTCAARCRNIGDSNIRRFPGNTSVKAEYLSHSASNHRQLLATSVLSIVASLPIQLTSASTPRSAVPTLLTTAIMFRRKIH